MASGRDVNWMKNKISGMYAHLESANELLVALFLYATLIVDLFRKLNDALLNFPGILVEMSRNALYVLIFLYVLLHAYKKGRLLFLVVVSVTFMALLVASAWAVPEIKVLVPYTALMFLSRCLMGLHLGMSIKDSVKLISGLKLFTPFAIAYALTVVFIPGASGDYMTLAYNLLIPFFVSVWAAIYEKRKIHIVFAALFLYTIIVYGARGPLLCIAAFIAVLLAYYIFADFKRRYPVLLAILLVGIVLIVGANDILGWAADRFPGSRTIMMLAEGNILDTSRRTEIYSHLWNVIMEAPLRIRGILSDRVLVSTLLELPIEDGLHAHNIFLELALGFGIAIGTLAIVSLACFVVVSFFYIRESDDPDLFFAFTMLASFVVIQLQISSSLITNALFWIFLGLMLNIMLSRDVRGSRLVGLGNR